MSVVALACGALPLLLALAPAQDPVVTPRPDIETRVRAMLAAIRADRLREDVRTLVSFGTRHVLSATDDPEHGTGAARAFLERELNACAERSGGRLRVARETHRVFSTRLRREVEIVNLVATLRGEGDPDRLYVVGGHYDSINGNPRDAEGPAPGANDDASGTAVVLEACRVMSQGATAAGPFRATILFVCYDAEEEGLLGSEAHAAALAAAGANVDGMISNDVVGNTLGIDGVRRNDWLRCFSYSPRGNDSSGRCLARAATFAARRHRAGLDVRLVCRGDRYGRGGDHRSFHARGWPAIRFTEPREDWSRQHANVVERDGKPYGDLPEYVDHDYLARVAAVNVALLAELASAPPPPTQLRARMPRDAYATLLDWRPVEGAAGYEAVWRETIAPDWQEARLLEAEPGRGGMLHVRLDDACLDDLVVGVRSIGADGSRSRAATPPEPDAFEQRPARGESRRTPDQDGRDGRGARGDDRRSG